jgi:DNA-binding protein H-NS
MRVQSALTIKRHGTVKIANHNILLERFMKKTDMQSLPIDDLWALHEQISKILSSRILSEKRQLEKRLYQLNSGKAARDAIAPDLNSEKANRTRRKFSKVLPKYRNPAVPSETWSGRGKQPRWLVSALKSGGTIKDFEIHDAQVR